MPTRTFCSTCHVPKATDHYDQRECTTCHFDHESFTETPFRLRGVLVLERLHDRFELRDGGLEVFNGL